jgi:hypothetical protein
VDVRLPIASDLAVALSINSTGAIKFRYLAFSQRYLTTVIRIAITVTPIDVLLTTLILVQEDML